MATPLKEFAIALGLLASDPAAVGPKLGLSGYVWQIADLARCQRARAAECELLVSRWDWKRPQWYRLSLLPNEGSGDLRIDLELDNQDRSDDDIVCLMILALSKNGEVIGADFVEIEVLSQHSVHPQQVIAVRPGITAARMEVGSKQCDETHVHDRKAALTITSKR